MTRFTSRLQLFALEGRDMPSVAAPIFIKKPELPTTAPITLTVAAPTPADQARGVVAAGKGMNQALAAFPAQKATPVSGPVSVALNPAARITLAPQSPTTGPGGTTVGPKASLQQQMFGLATPASAASPLTLQVTTPPTAGTPSALTASTDAFKAWAQANGESRAVSRTDMQSEGDTATEPTDDAGAEKTTGQKVWDAAGSVATKVSNFAYNVLGDLVKTTIGKVAATGGGVANDLLNAPGVLEEAKIDPAEAARGVNAAAEYEFCKTLQIVSQGAKPMDECLKQQMQAKINQRQSNAQRPDPTNDGMPSGGATNLGTFGGVTIRGHLTQPAPGEAVWQKIDPTLGRALMADSMAAGQGTKINPARGDGNVEVGGPVAPRDGVDCPPEKQGNGVGTPGRPSA